MEVCEKRGASHGNKKGIHLLIVMSCFLGCTRSHLPCHRAGTLPSAPWPSPLSHPRWWTWRPAWRIPQTPTYRSLPTEEPLASPITAIIFRIHTLIPILNSLFVTFSYLPMVRIAKDEEAFLSDPDFVHWRPSGLRFILACLFRWTPNTAILWRPFIHRLPAVI